MNKAVIFDLDGTLIDSLPDIFDSVNATLHKFNANERTYGEVMQFIGSGAAKIIENAFGGNLTKEQLKSRLDYYNDLYTNSGSPKTKVFDGIKEVIVDLKNRGYKIAILTNKPQSTTDDVYNNYLKDFGFDLVIGQSENVICKPDKAAAENILNQLDVKKENTFFVGDGETDVLTAINSGTKGIAVLWGYRSKEQLAIAGATVFAEKPSDLIKLINL